LFLAMVTFIVWLNIYEKGKLSRVISPDVKNCSKLLKKTAKEKIVFMDNLRNKLEYIPKEKSTA